ncbi:putative glycoside hydrolase [Oscillospiraceae bacterium OttesenSCG-928-G22]|nr:putative glycoside hydrolase [Oscillospiraceae bacterium OttesenSCG-928-G22]
MGIAILILFLAAAVALFVYYVLQNGNPFAAGPSAAPATASPSATPEPTDDAPTPTLIIESPTPSDPIVLSGMRAVYLPDLTDTAAVDAAVALAKAGQIDAVACDMKREDGTLAFRSDVSAARTAEASADASPVGAIEKLQGANLRLIARVSAFRDDLAPRKVQVMSVKVESGVIWLDQNYHAWLNPYSNTARKYLIDLSLELADLGFDEILLTNLCFPTKGKPGLIVYGADEPEKPEAILSFVEELKDALAPSGTSVSATLAPEAFSTGLFVSGGQNFAELYTACDSVYAAMPASNPQTVLDGLLELLFGEDELPEGDAIRLVPIVTPPRAYTDPRAGEQISVAVGAAGGDLGLSCLVVDESGRYPDIWE